MPKVAVRQKKRIKGLCVATPKLPLPQRGLVVESRECEVAKVPKDGA